MRLCLRVLSKIRNPNQMAVKDFLGFGSLFGIWKFNKEEVWCCLFPVETQWDLHIEANKRGEAGREAHNGLI